MGLFDRIVDEEEERGRVFTWARDKRVWMHLLAFLLFSVIIHGSGFYLFKVVYPSPVRVEAEPDGITVMEPSDPVTRSTLQRLSDRTIYLMAPSARSELRVRQETHPVHFTPAFRRADLKLAPPPALLPGPGKVEPLPPSAHDETPRTEERVPVKLDPALAKRSLAPWSVLHDYLALAEAVPSVRCSIEVAPGGEVRVLSLDAALAEGEKRELVAVIESTLRFLPAAETAQGWIELGEG